MTQRLVFTITAASCLGLALASCTDQKNKAQPAAVRPSPTWKISLFNDTVGAVAEVEGLNSIPVRGYGLVMGLANTGSRECPDQILEIIETGLRGRTRPDGKPLFGDVSIRTIVNDPNTAVVAVDGLIPPAAAAGDRIDLEVVALPNTQTTSLVGGELSVTELSIEVVTGEGVAVRKSAMVLAGYPELEPIFLNPFSSDDPARRPTWLTTGRIIGGGRVLASRPLYLVLQVPGGSYRMARQIADRLNFRFPTSAGEPRTAEALSDSRIQLVIPNEYHDRQSHFLMLVLQTYLPADPVYLARRVDELIAELANSDADAERITASLESVGKITVPELRKAYESNDPRVRFYAARTAALLDDHQAVPILSQVASDDSSSYQMLATVALGDLPNRYLSSQALRPLLDSGNTMVRIRAYEALDRNLDPSVTPVTFEYSAPLGLHVVRSNGQPLIYVQTSKKARIVLFGRDIHCQLPMFYLSPDKSLTITSQPGMPENSPPPTAEGSATSQPEQPLEQITILRRTPSGDIGLILKTSPDLISLIKTMSSDIEPDYQGVHHGLGLDYSQTVSAIYGLWQKKFLPAGFVLQQSPGARQLLEEPARISGQRPETSPP